MIYLFPTRMNKSAVFGVFIVTEFQIFQKSLCEAKATLQGQKNLEGGRHSIIFKRNNELETGDWIKT